MTEIERIIDKHIDVIDGTPIAITSKEEFAKDISKYVIKARIEELENRKKRTEKHLENCEKLGHITRASQNWLWTSIEGDDKRIAELKKGIDR